MALLAQVVNFACEKDDAGLARSSLSQLSSTPSDDGGRHQILWSLGSPFTALSIPPGKREAADLLAHTLLIRLWACPLVSWPVACCLIRGVESLEWLSDGPYLESSPTYFLFCPQKETRGSPQSVNTGLSL